MCWTLSQSIRRLRDKHRDELYEINIEMNSGEIKVVNGSPRPSERDNNHLILLRVGSQSTQRHQQYPDQLTHPHRGWLLTDWVDTSPSDPVPLLQNSDGRVGKKGKNRTNLSRSKCYN